MKEKEYNIILHNIFISLLQQYNHVSDDVDQSFLSVVQKLCVTTRF